MNEKNLLALLKFVNRFLAAGTGMPADDVMTLAVLVHNLVEVPSPPSDPSCSTCGKVDKF